MPNHSNRNAGKCVKKQRYTNIHALTHTHNDNHHFQLPSLQKLVHTVHAHQTYFSITVERDDRMNPL